jgi:outer membrane protein assembly factor BamB
VRVPQRTSLSTALSGLVVGLFLSGPAPGADWPTHQHDYSRSGVTEEALQLPLTQAWVYRAPRRPIPAWDEPARWDGWNRADQLRNRVAYDKVFNVAVVGTTLYFGSSVDDKLYAFDAKTGEARWSFFAEGPIRLAPTVADSTVYFGADDGKAYALEAATGKLVWKRVVAPEDRRIIGNGRLISVWPVRTGAVVADGRIYCGAGVFPSETLYFCALEQASGEVVWRTELTSLPLQGYILASRSKLYVPTGRGGPLAFDRVTGAHLFGVGEGRGTYALLSDDRLVTNGGSNGRRTSFFSTSGGGALARVAAELVAVAGERSFLMGDGKLSALDHKVFFSLTEEQNTLERKHGRLAKEMEAAKKKGRPPESEKEAELAGLLGTLRGFEGRFAACHPWETEGVDALALIVAGTTLYTGEDGAVAAYDTASGRELWRGEVEGKAYGLAVAGGGLFVSTDTGTIHCFRSHP